MTTQTPGRVGIPLAVYMALAERDALTEASMADVTWDDAGNRMYAVGTPAQLAEVGAYIRSLAGLVADRTYTVGEMGGYNARKLAAIADRFPELADAEPETDDQAEPLPTRDQTEGITADHVTALAEAAMPEDVPEGYSVRVVYSANGTSPRHGGSVPRGLLDAEHAARVIREGGFRHVDGWYPLRLVRADVQVCRPRGDGGTTVRSSALVEIYRTVSAGKTPPRTEAADITPGAHVEVTTATGETRTGTIASVSPWGAELPAVLIHCVDGNAYRARVGDVRPLPFGSPEFADAVLSAALNANPEPEDDQAEDSTEPPALYELFNDHDECPAWARPSVPAPKRD